MVTPAYYDPFPVDNVKNFACALGKVSPHFQDHFAAVKGSLFPDGGGAGHACGACLAVQCVDSATCPGGSRSIVQVLDDCGSCNAGDILLNPTAFREVVGSGSRTQVTWTPVSCEENTEGAMYLTVLPGGNDYFYQFSISNAAKHVAEVSVNGNSLSNENGRWTWTSNGQKLDVQIPMKMELVAAGDGRRVTTELQELASQSLNVQF